MFHRDGAWKKRAGRIARTASVLLLMKGMALLAADSPSRGVTGGPPVVRDLPAQPVAPAAVEPARSDVCNACFV